LDVPLEKFRRMFPNLIRELEQAPMEVKIDSMRADLEVGERIASESLMGYNPNVIDFLRRCDKEEEAREIIDYMVKRRKISPEYAERLLNQLKIRGVRGFGAKKENNYYIMRGKRKTRG
jgi:hypothetical protein